MIFSIDDTIVAIASASGGAQRGILRVTGPATRSCLEAIVQFQEVSHLANVSSATVIPGSLRLPPPLAALPCDIYFWPNERSYTRQPTAEIHTIGSPPLLEAAMRTLCQNGARLAEPGEFTLRAFLAGRLDLTQAEAVLGVIDAGDRVDLDVALHQLAGGLAGPLNELRDRLLDLLAHLEAGLDFVEEDIEFISANELDQQIEQGKALVDQLLQRMTSRSESRGEARVVLIGSPNVGKSSLLNALAGEHAAIVADQPGTTRDYVARRISIAGVPCLLIDTAGVADEGDADSIATRAQAMTSQQHRQAHLRLFCMDASRPLNAWEKTQLALESHKDSVFVLTKVDCTASLFPSSLESNALRTSSVTGEGLDLLRSLIAQRLAESAARDSVVVASTAIRCQDSLRLATECLTRARHIAQHQLGEELVAAELRVALDELGKVVGAVYTDDVLDRIFSRFCIGK